MSRRFVPLDPRAQIYNDDPTDLIEDHNFEYIEQHIDELIDTVELEEARVRREKDDQTPSKTQD